MHSLKRLIILIILFIEIHWTVSINSQQEAQIDRLIEDVFMKANIIPGLGLTIVEDYRATVLAKGYGLRDIQSQLPASNNTKFCIASISKTFTATLVVKTLNEKFPEAGASALDTPIKDLLPSGNFTFSDRYRSESMTFRDLLSHKHGIRDDNLALYFGSTEGFDEYTYRTRYMKEAMPFRTIGYYNNAFYALAGKLISEIAQKPFTQLLGELFLEIGMTETTYVKETEDYNSLPNMAKGYYSEDAVNALAFNMSLINRIHVAVPAGGIISNSLDFSKYISFHLNLGSVGNKEVVPKEVMLWLRRPTVPVMPNFKTSDNDFIYGDVAVGTGLVIGTYDGWQSLGHSGSWTPFTSLMLFYPELGLGTFTVINGVYDLHEGYDHRYIAREIFKIVTGTETLDKQIETKSHLRDIGFGKNIQKIKRPTTTIKQQFNPSIYVGLYGNPENGDIEITLSPQNATTLSMKLGKYGTGNLIPIDNNSPVYIIQWTSDILQDFYFNLGTLVETYLQFLDENTLYFYFDQRNEFKRNATLETYPQIPWLNDSCGPEY